MISRNYEALLLDLDGTIVGAAEGAEAEGISPRVRHALAELRSTGVVVGIATGRSETGTAPVLEQLDLDDPVVVYNGAGVWDPRAGRFLEERLLSRRTLTSLMTLVADSGWLPVVQGSAGKFAPPPRTEAEVSAFANFARPTHYTVQELPLEGVMRVSLFSEDHADSAAFAARVESVVRQPIYVTHFPLRVLAAHRTSPLFVLDVQPPCRGKAEALRFLEESRGIPPERVVAVGDANNDVPMLRAAGLGVAMGNAMGDAKAAADRVIGSVEENAVADLVEELFGIRVRS